MAAIHESFKGCQHYELSTSKVREHFTTIRHSQFKSGQTDNLQLVDFLQTVQDPTDKPAKKKGKKKTKADTDDGKKSETTDDQWVKHKK